jgi:hypothetical protein
LVKQHRDQQDDGDRHPAAAAAALDHGRVRLLRAIGFGLPVQPWRRGEPA